MHIRIVAVGKLKERFVRDGVEMYLMRLRKYCPIDVVEVKESLSQTVSVAMDDEGKRLLEKAHVNVVFALDPHGKPFSSEEFASLLKDKQSVAFIIGGAHGLSDEVRRCANLIVSFSRMTFSHELCRLLLAEQLYRAMTILKNHPYHK